MTPRREATRAGESTAGGTLLLNRAQVAELLDLDACITAVEDAFRAHAAGRSIPPTVVSAHVDGGGFHIKAAGITGETPYFVAKLNGNFFANPERGLPRIQGLVVVCDASNGYPLAVMDSTEITAVRTAAATAVAAKHLALSKARVATICGCGLQGRVQLEALVRVRPIESVWAFDLEPEIARRYAAELGDALGIEIIPTTDLAAAARLSDVIITCTPSRTPLLFAGDVEPGAFVAAVGADSEEKQELDPAILVSADVVADSRDQCAEIGELHHALASGALTPSSEVSELHQVIAGERPARRSDDQIFVFDSTGVALQDVAAAVLVLERARNSGTGTRVELL